MPNWRKLIVSGSDASLNSLTVNGAITADTISGSFSGSYVGDGSGLTNLTTDITEVATISDTFTSTTSKTVNHYFGTKDVIVTVYNDSDQQIIPATVTTTDINTVTVTFDSNTTGRVVVAKGGHLVSGSAVLVNSTVVSSSAQISSFNTFLEIQGDNVVSGSSQIDYTLITNVPSGIVSSSAQVDYTSLQNIPLGIVSGSTQVDYTQLQNIPSGIVSGSSQVQFNSVSNNPFISSSTAITASAHFVPNLNETYDLGSANLRWRDLYLSGSTVYLGETKITRTQQGDVEFRDSQTDALRKIRVDELEIGSGASARKIQVDGSGRIKFATTGDEDKTIEALGFTGIVTSSAQLSFDEIPGIPSGLVSSSIQVDLTQTTNFTTGIKGRLNVEGVASGSASQIRSFLNVENGATADQTKQDIDALNIDAATVGGFTVGKSVPSNAVFTDTTYSVQDGGLTQKNFTTELYNKLNAIEASADVTDAGNVTPILNSLSVLSGSITSAKITDVDAFSQSGTYANLRAQATTKADVGLGNVTNESKATMFTNAALTGNPTAPTQTSTDDSTKIATTAFVQGRIDAIIGTAGSTLDTLGELSASLASDQSALSSLTTTVGTKLAKSSNLSDLTNVSTARTNLGLGTAATTAATDYATAAQGSNADTAYGWGNHASAGYLTTETYTAHEDTSTLSGLYGGSNNGIVIEDITVDSNGHITAIGTRDLDGRFATAAQGTKADTAVQTLADLSITATATELNYSDGVTSNIQTQLNGKQAAGTYNTVIGTDTDISYTGATVLSAMTMTDGVIQSHSSRTLTLADLGYTGATNANYYTHPTYAGDDINLDTTPLTGATVISDLDFNITTDTSGHVTDANATYATRNLTLADLGYTGATNANYITNNNQLTNGAGYTTYTADQPVDTTSSPTFASPIVTNLYVAGTIYHNGDTNSYITFPAADDFQIVVGGRQLIRMDEGTDPDIIQLGDSSTLTTTLGKLGVGTANPASPLEVYGSGSTVFDVQGSVGQLFSVTDDLTGTIFAVSDISGIPILEVDSTGIVTIDDTLRVTGDITAYYSSDERLKKNIKPIENPLEKLKLISGNTFEWDETNPAHKNTGKDIGVIAQEIEKILPEIVTERRGGYKAVQYEKVVALLIESNKALLERVEKLERKLK